MSKDILGFLLEKPEFERILRYAVAWEEDPKNESGLGWSNWDVHAPRRDVDKLIYVEIAKVSYSSSKHIHFKLMDLEATKEALETFVAFRAEPVEEAVALPEDLFSIIVGYDDVKEMLKKDLESEKPVGCLLIGPPSSGKSLLLEELNRLLGSSYHLGSSATKAGLTQFLLTMRPRYLLIDEFDKMSGEDYAALLSLMESGKVVETKYGRRSEEYMKVWVFATCNRTKGIPPENLSRFPFQFYFREYTQEEYAEVVVRVLTEREGLEPGLAAYIASQLVQFSRDVRKAVGIGRVCSKKDEIDQMIKTLKKYRGV